MKVGRGGMLGAGWHSRRLASDSDDSSNEAAGASEEVIATDEQPYPSAFLLRGRPGVNVYQSVPSFDPDRHFSPTRR